MTQNYYSVTLRLGHVGRNKYVVKTVPICAEDGKDAASKARWMGRAKHHQKDTILEVNKISYEEYLTLEEKKNQDSFFKVKNIQEQRIECPELEEMAEYYDDDIDYEFRKEQRKNKIEFKQRKNKLYKSETISMMRNYDLAISY